jgi:alkanesulfonate monooxygenase SsuD/methylene tetrahydromethanopterin reductase-like flavin-dependent oxidoreductase (luciferase family)
MTETTEDTATFTIALTEDGAVAEPSPFPWILLAALAGGLYYLSRRG